MHPGKMSAHDANMKLFGSGANFSQRSANAVTEKPSCLVRDLSSALDLARRNSLLGFDYRQIVKTISKAAVG
jgi:hypothetical protein